VPDPSSCSHYDPPEDEPDVLDAVRRYYELLKAKRQAIANFMTAEKHLEESLLVALCEAAPDVDCDPIRVIVGNSLATIWPAAVRPSVQLEQLGLAADPTKQLIAKLCEAANTLEQVEGYNYASLLTALGDYLTRGDGGEWEPRDG
jgi:hypothetical protein